VQLAFAGGRSLSIGLMRRYIRAVSPPVNRETSGGGLGASASSGRSSGFLPLAARKAILALIAHPDRRGEEAPSATRSRRCRES
jgi:hypothetical protein